MAAGGKAARGEDANRLREHILRFLPPCGLNEKTKEERGFNNDVTGALLCPTGYNWDNPSYVYTFLLSFR